MLRIGVPLAWMVLYLALAILLPRFTLYTQLIFYVGLIVWFRRDFSMPQFLRGIGNVRYLIGVLLTAAGLYLCYQLTDLLSEKIFMTTAEGTISVVYYTTFELLLFSLSTIFLMPIAEELFFRKAMVCMTEGMGFFLLTACVSTLLYALSQAHGWLGVMEYLIIGLPLLLSYVLTRNIYVPILAHMIVLLIIKVPNIVYDLARMMLR
ncbi:MAG: CPBP family intramembrane metalloprotease [Lachnospiraceae bacterium]|nr:CPBP family intramembrane metalloprotease [Lachnospiraceae bacterium]